jgi:hypothetical protein
VFGIVACVRLKNVNRGINIAAVILFAVNAVIEVYYLFKFLFKLLFEF